MKSSLDRLIVDENNLKMIKFNEIILFFFKEENHWDIWDNIKKF